MKKDQVFFSIQIKRTKIRSQGVFLHVTTNTWFVQQMAKHLVAIDDENIWGPTNGKCSMCANM